MRKIKVVNPVRWCGSRNLRYSLSRGTARPVSKISSIWLLIAVVGMLTACDNQSEMNGKIAVFSPLVIKTGSGSVPIAPGVYDAEVDYLVGDGTDSRPITGNPLDENDRTSAPPQARIAITYQGALVEVRIAKNMNVFNEPPESLVRQDYQAALLIKGNVFDIPQEWDAGTRINVHAQISFLTETGHCLAQLHAVGANDAQPGDDISDVPEKCPSLGVPNDPLGWTTGGSNGVTVFDASTLNASKSGKRRKP